MSWAETPADGLIVGDTEGDRAVRPLGIVRLAIPIPFGQSGGPVNVYLIDNPDGTLTLFDAGLGTDEALDALDRGFAEAGRKITEVSRILLSHGHVDHHGAARRVVERSGARVFIHPAERSKVVATVWPEPVRELHRRYLRRMGVPADLVAEMEGLEESTALLGEPLERVERIEGGERLAFRGFEATVLHLPGHTAGLIGLHLPEHKVLFSADHLLQAISPNPFLELGEGGEQSKPHSLELYIRSARQVEALELDWILPGHGKPFTDHRAVLASLSRFYARRQAKLTEALRGEPRSAYELVRSELGRGRRLQLFLMLSEIIGNLEVLESSGAIERIETEELVRFRARS